MLTAPGATPASTDLTERLLEQDREEHHCFYGPVPFHNHLSHHILAAYDLGAPPALLQAMYDEEASEVYNIYTKNTKTREIEKQNVVLDRDNWTDYLGKHAYDASLLSGTNPSSRSLTQLLRQLPRILLAASQRDGS